VSRARAAIAKPIALAFVAAIIASAAGALSTDIGPWYYSLVKPSWQPPDWLFGPVWTTIYACAAIAASLAWLRAPSRSQRITLLIAFAVNLGLNILWSLMFFRMQRPDFALYEVGFLWLSIVVLIGIMWNYSRTSSLLLVPYLLWVSFAAYLNFTIVQLNAPFPGR
jgi:tryptophan-rich sensory protein